MSNDLRFRATMEDKVSTSLDRMSDKMALTGKKAVLMGVGIAAGQKAFQLLAGALHAAEGAIRGAIDGALEQEKLSARLDTALKANVAGWDGNRDAINRYIESQTQRGFTDNETTAAMAQLVAATGNVQTAMTYLNTAQDLARLRGISLAEATDALTKVEGGSYRILKSLGIELAKGATQTEALAAVQKIAAGQADAFAKTSAGSMAVFSAKVDHLNDQVGEHLIPILKLLADNASAAFDVLDNTKHADALVDQTKAFVAAGYSSGIYEQSLQGLIEQYRAALDSGHATEQELHDLETILILVGTAAKNVHPQFGSLGRAADDLRGPIAGVQESLVESDQSLRYLGRDIDLAAKAADKAKQPTKDYFDVYTAVVNKGDIAQTTLDLLDDRKAINDAKTAMEKAVPGTDKYKRAQLELAVAQGKLAGDMETLHTKQAELFLLKPDPKNKAALDKWFSSLGHNALDLQGDLKKAYDTLYGITGVKPGTTLNFSVVTGGGKAKASGGWVGLSGPEIALVGEKGPEYIVPNNQLGGGMGGMGGGGGRGQPVIIQLQIGSQVIGRLIDEHLYYEASRAAPTAQRT